MSTRTPVSVAVLTLAGVLALAAPAASAGPAGSGMGPAAADAPVVTVLPPQRRAVPVQRLPGAAKVDLRPDLVASLATEPSVPMLGVYDYRKNGYQPLKVTAVVENAGIGTADKVDVTVTISRMPGVPMAQNSWQYHYTVDLGAGESVSYPFSAFFHATTVTISAKALFSGNEKSTTNNGAMTMVKFP